MTSSQLSAPGTETIAPSSPASRPSPTGGLRPVLTPAAGGTRGHLPGANKEDQHVKIRLTEVSTAWRDCRRNMSSALSSIAEREGKTMSQIEGEALEA
jgi:hypothetical protein